MFTKNIDIENKIKKEFENKTISVIQNISDNFLKNNFEINEYLKNYLNNIPEWESIKHIIYGIVFNIELKHCIACGKLLTYSKSILNGKYCSRKCCLSSSSFRESVKNSVIEKYGVDNVSKVEKIKKKAIKTYYNKKNNELLNQKNEKRNNTLIKKYGSLKNYYKITSEKRKQTLLNKFGVEFSFQRKEIKEKIKETLKKRYGDSNGSLQKYYSKIIRDKAYKNSLEKNGIFDKNAEIFWKKIQTVWKNYIIPLFEKKDYHGKNNVYKWKCVKCGNKFESRIYCTGHMKNVDWFLPRCLNCYPLYKGESQKERELLEFCKNFFPNIGKTRKLIYPYEIDVLIEDIKLCLEFNGHWYHSKENNTKKGKHLEKVKKCNKKGYRLIHIWEDEWDKNKEQIKEKLKEIFQNKENLNFTDEIIKLDRSWFNNINIPRI